MHMFKILVIIIASYHLFFGYVIRRQEFTYRCYPCGGGFGVPIHVTVELDVVSHQASDGRRLGYRRRTFQRKKGNSSEREKDRQKDRQRERKRSYKGTRQGMRTGPLASKVEVISISKIRKRRRSLPVKKNDRQRK